jgi:hypothetical protein
MDAAARTHIGLSGLTENEAFELEPNRDKWVYATGVAAGFGFITISADCTAPLELPIKVTDK